MRTLLLQALVALVALAGNGAIGQEQGCSSVQSDASFSIGGGSVILPVGVFLLIRQNFNFGAIRVTQYQADSTGFLDTSQYESYSQSKAAGSFDNANAEKHVGVVQRRPSKGPGRGLWIYEPGSARSHEAQVGSWSFPLRLNEMTMSDISHWSGIGDHGFEFAPTSVCALADIDVNDSALKWYRFDRSTNRIRLKVSELAK